MTDRISLKDKIAPYLNRVIRPARYTGGELNMVKKDPEAQNISVCLAFPDIYDIGQSYIGFHILYHILNKREGTLCERAFQPWPDMDDVMRAAELPLWSMENFLPVSSFDVVGFTLQYELHYSTVLNMLDLAGIPMRSDERGEDDPIILGGGTCVVNPEPMAVYFDAYMIGDGEEGFPEMLDVIESAKAEGIPRAEILKRLAHVEGVYVPSLYEVKRDENGVYLGLEPLDESAPPVVHARYVDRMKAEFYPDKPLVPVTEVVHDRLAAEIMRGCTRGCRFCSAGMSYRPRRSRPPEDIINQVVNGIKETGWDEVSLVSLSSTDYPSIGQVVKEIGRKLEGKAVSISLSSLRADNFSLKMADATAGGRKTSLTFAPEAGTQRLRDVINKNLTEEQLLETIKSALEQGFGNLKLYFMIGLPTETEEDTRAIGDLLNRIGSIVRQYKGRRVNVTVSPFCPKPVTPFQWEAQASVEEFRDKMRSVRSNLRSKAINIRQSNPKLSVLEGAIARGGREIADIVMSAWKRGSKLDGWSEFFNEDLWHGVFQDAGIALDEGSKAVEPGTALPWGHLHFGVEESFLLKERELAFKAETVCDCRENCHNCGPYAAFCNAFNKEEADLVKAEEPSVKSAQSASFGRKRKPAALNNEPLDILGTRLRVKYRKGEAVRYSSHLDMIRMFDRTLRRAEIPVAYSQGFHPHPKISFGYPLPLGFKSDAEYIDISLSKLFPAFETDLRDGMPAGFELLAVSAVPDKTSSLTKIVTIAEYFVQCELTDALEERIRETLALENIMLTRKTKKGEKTVDIRPGIEKIAVTEDRNGFVMLLHLEQEISVKPSEVITLLFPDGAYADVTRTEQYAVTEKGLVTPLEILW